MNKQEALSRFHRLMNAAKLSDSTHRSYHLWAARMIDYIEPADVRSLTLFDAQDFMLHISEDCSYADRTYNQGVDAIRYFFSAVMGIEIGPKQLTKRRLEKVQKNPITPAQAQLLLSGTQDRFLRAVIALSYGCGLRACEIVKLKFQDVSESEKGIKQLTISESKGKKTRTVVYPPSVAQILNEYCFACGTLHQHDPDQYVFHKAEKPRDKLSTSAVTNSFAQYLRTFAFYLPDQTFHGLRHAYATAMAYKNIPPVIIQNQMGHASLATTALYIHAPLKVPEGLPDLLVERFDEDE